MDPNMLLIRDILNAIASHEDPEALTDYEFDDINTHLAMLEEAGILINIISNIFTLRGAEMHRNMSNTLYWEAVARIPGQDMKHHSYELAIAVMANLVNKTYTTDTPVAQAAA